MRPFQPISPLSKRETNNGRNQMKKIMITVLVGMFSVSCGLTTKDQQDDAGLQVYDNQEEMSIYLDLPAEVTTTSDLSLSASAENNASTIQNMVYPMPMPMPNYIRPSSEYIKLNCGITDNNDSVGYAPVNEPQLEDTPEINKTPLVEKALNLSVSSPMPYVTMNFSIALQKKNSKGTYESVAEQKSSCFSRIKVTLGALQNSTYRLVASYKKGDSLYEGISSSFSKNTKRIELVMKKLNNDQSPIVYIVWDNAPIVSCPSIAKLFFLCKEGKQVDQVALGVCSNADITKAKSLLSNGYQSSRCEVFTPEPKIIDEPSLEPSPKICTDIAGKLIHKETEEVVKYTNGCQLSDLLDTGKYTK